MATTSSEYGCAEQNPQSKASETAQRIGMLLARLRLHCPFRQQYTEAQAKLVIEDMIRDLLAYGAPTIDAACEAWRKGTKPWFPTSGQLIEKAREARENVPSLGPPARNFSPRERDVLSRPHLWWLAPFSEWEPHWDLEDIPEIYVEQARAGKLHPFSAE